MPIPRPLSPRMLGIMGVAALLAVAAVHALWPSVIAPEHVSAVGFAGAALVVVGSALSSLLGQSKPES